MSTTTQLELVITAKDKASATLRDISRQLSSTASSFPKFSSYFGKEMSLIGTAAKAASVGIASIGAALTAVGVSAVKSASSYEQSRIAFETMLGSADKAKNLLKDITKFAKETPFELPEVVEGSKRLLAYNISAEQLIPTFKMLGEIASGVGKEKLPELILAFGQVKAATKLTGMELRQFTEAGVPMLSILTQLGKEGKLASQSSKSLGASTAGSGAAIKDFSSKLAIAKQRLKEVKANSDAKKSSIMSAQAAVERYSAKLSSATKIVSGFGNASSITEGQIQEMISEGKIKFADVQLALQALTEEGGRFNGLMIRQSKTLSGLYSNVKDVFGTVLRAVVGINEEGEVRGGSLFDKLRVSASTFYSYLETNKDAITNFLSSKVDYAVQKIKEWYDSIGGAQGIKQALTDLWDKLTNEVFPVLERLGEIFVSVTKFIADNWSIIWKVILAYEALKLTLYAGGVIQGMVAFAGTIKAATLALAGTAGLYVALGAIVAILTYQVVKSFRETQKAMDDVRNSVANTNKQLDLFQTKVGTLSTEKANQQLQNSINKAKELNDEAGRLADRYSGLQGVFNAVKDAAGDAWKKIQEKFKGSGSDRKALGGSVAQGTPYVVGEYRPEVFVPSQSGNIRQMSQMQKEVNINFNNVSVRSDQDINEIAYRVKKILNREQEMYQLGAL